LDYPLKTGLFVAKIFVLKSPGQCTKHGAKKRDKGSFLHIVSLTCFLEKGPRFGNMPDFNSESLQPLFYPRSIALAGVTVDNPQHWTRTFLDSLLEFQFGGPLYLVNPKGGEIGGIKVYRRFADIAQNVDYVISTVPAKAAPGLIEECAHKGVKGIHFCTAGFSETGEEEGVRLEPQLADLSRRTGIRIIGPNCMGIYCPGSRLSFDIDFPKESGPVGFISQSGGNTGSLIRRVMSRGVRFSKVVSYGNACDLNESDFLEYLAADSETEVIGLYIEGVKDGRRFLQTLQKTSQEKTILLLKGGITEGGARAAVSHTGSLAGSDVIWDSLCKQLGIIQVHSLEEFADSLVTLRFMSDPRGRRVALIGGGGGSSVLIADQFERRGLKVPPLPREMRNRVQKFTPLAGNILRNPIDYSQNMTEPEKLLRTVRIIAQWQEIDFLICFLELAWIPLNEMDRMHKIIDGMLAESRAALKPLGIVAQTDISPEQVTKDYSFLQKCVSSWLPIYYSFAGAAHAINLVLTHNERRLGSAWM
jgi:acyl-CoA synthetase (NDP forming)